ncbi:MAG: hypothetical protein ACRC80_08515 [Waterburya sp.]
MPLPQPQFNNQIDPYLPQVIKPEIYQFDEYQTSDFCWIEHDGYKINIGLASWELAWEFTVIYHGLQTRIMNGNSVTAYFTESKKRSTGKWIKFFPGTRIKDSTFDQVLLTFPSPLVYDAFFPSSLVPKITNPDGTLSDLPIGFQSRNTDGIFTYQILCNYDAQEIETNHEMILLEDGIFQSWTEYKDFVIQRMIEKGSKYPLNFFTGRKGYTLDPGRIFFVIQRFTPDNLPWAESYIQKMFNKIATFKSQTKITGVYERFNNPYLLIQSTSRQVVRIPGNFFSEAKFTINLPNTAIGEIFLSYLYVETPNVYAKHFLRIDCKIKKHEITIKNLVYCSLVVSGTSNPSLITDIENQLDSYSTEVLYKNLDNYIDKKIVQNPNWQIQDGEDTPISTMVLAANNNRWNQLQPLEDISSGFFRNPLVGTIEEVDALYYSTNTQGEYTREMPDSPRIMEIHAALNAAKFAKDGNKDRISNLGFYIEFISQVLGGSFNPDGTTRSIRQMRRIPDGSVVPGGWDRGQFSVNERGKTEGQVGGAIGEYAPGIVYQQRTNKLKPDKFNPEKSEIEGGDLILCENWIQFFEAFLDDLNKGLGWQDLGASAIPNADGSDNIALFEGLHQQVSELLYMLSAVSGQTAKTHISANVSQAIVKEIISGLGLPLQNSAIDFEFGNDENGQVPYPALADKSPTLTQQLGWILQNIGHLQISNIAS